MVDPATRIDFDRSQHDVSGSGQTATVHHAEPLPQDDIVERTPGHGVVVGGVKLSGATVKASMIFPSLTEETAFFLLAPGYTYLALDTGDYLLWDRANNYLWLQRDGTEVWRACKQKLDAVAAPTFDDDSGDGYGVGSLWCDVTNDKVYICLDPAAGLAVWREVDALGHEAAADPHGDYVLNAELTAHAAIAAAHHARYTDAEAITAALTIPHKGVIPFGFDLGGQAFNPT